LTALRGNIWPKPLIAVSCAGGLLGLVLLALVLGKGAPAHAAMAGSSTPVSVSITGTGADPDVITVTVGTEVVWTNLTQQTVP
jgi:plastocyanin